MPFAKAVCPEVASGRLIFGLAPPVGAVKSASALEPFSSDAATPAPVSEASGRAEDDAAEATTFEAPVIVVALSSSELPLDMSSI